MGPSIRIATDTSGRLEARSRRRHFEDYQLLGLITAGLVTIVVVWILLEPRKSLLLSITIGGSIACVLAFGAILVWDRYPRRTELTSRGVVFYQRLGSSQVSWANLGPPIRNEGRWILFRTDPKTPGFGGAPVIVDRMAARMILQSSLRNSWAIPPEFQYLVESEKRPDASPSATAKS